MQTKRQKENQSIYQMSINNLTEETKIQNKLPFKEKLLKDKTTLQCVPGENHVGNFNPFPHSRILEVVNFLKPYCDHYVVTAEGADPVKANNEHIHFWVSNIKKPIDSIKKQIIRKFPELKRQGRGGARKWEFKPLKEEHQLNYIFKEQNKQNFLKTIMSNIFGMKNWTNIEKRKKDYLNKKAEMQEGQDSKFLNYLYQTIGPTKNIGEIVSIYAQYAVEKKLKRVTKWQMLSAVNFVLLRTDRSNLVKYWTGFAESQIAYHGVQVNFN